MASSDIPTPPLTDAIAAWREHSIGFTWRDEEQRYGEERAYLAGYGAAAERTAQAEADAKKWMALIREVRSLLHQGRQAQVARRVLGVIDAATLALVHPSELQIMRAAEAGVDTPSTPTREPFATQTIHDDDGSTFESIIVTGTPAEPVPSTPTRERRWCGIHGEVEWAGDACWEAEPAPSTPVTVTDEIDKRLAEAHLMTCGTPQGGCFMPWCACHCHQHSHAALSAPAGTEA